MNTAVVNALIPSILTAIRTSSRSLVTYTMPIQDKQVKEFLLLVSGGNRPSTAAYSLGISWPELNRYLTLGRNGIKPFTELYVQFRQAQAQAEIFDNELLTKAMREGKVEAIKFALVNRHGWKDKVEKKTHRHDVRTDNTGPALQQMDKEQKSEYLARIVRERNQEKQQKQKIFQYLREQGIDPERDILTIEGKVVS